MPQCGDFIYFEFRPRAGLGEGRTNSVDRGKLASKGGGTTRTLSAGCCVEVMKGDGVLGEVGEIGEFDGFSDDWTSNEKCMMRSERVDSK